MYTALRSAAVVLFSFANAIQAQTIDLTKASVLQPIGTKLESVSYNGKAAVKVTSGEPNPKGPGLAIVQGVQFQNGTIEVDLAGEPAKGAGEGARGFIGLAFRIAGQGERYECIYIRPTNGRADDQVRRNHSTQYMSFPDYPWFRLRKEAPEKYESYVDIQPGVWAKIRITVSESKARLFVNGTEQPSLIVNDLKLPPAAGGIALWIEPNTDGHFANLRVTKE